ncbi:DsbA family protein [Nocardioides marmorisolisilvae]|uniref:Disulfide bond formation protein DsbA n=1 Tax=Nocardioides marmorisolisilvae TaxID=1542737 RepID=A0A3N0DSY8_9ACTN|nr:thioredoxin domain-containing protein [Nocardioides marmorisolisilvae]RNL78744.1 disulfide bond formation protein DsbA [Nocardioides marmorisolisilvae]
MSKQNREVGRTERAAAIRADQARQERNRRIGLVALIVVILGAVVAAGTWYSGGGPSDKPAAAVTATAGEGSVLAGKADAPVKVVVYEDFQCPYCRQLEDSTRDFLRENAAAGKVQVEYRPIDLLQSVYGERGMNAFAAVLAHSTPQAALKLHDLLYENQPYESDSGSVSQSQILGFVKKAGGDNAAVEAALKTQDNAFFQAASAVMAQKKITSTPTVFINGKPVSGGVPQIVDAIEKAVG